ncbi:hypothetical protein BJ981_004377 [Sphaerisporangium krabiense]|uniref:Uncharacterized protein n=1 Tax=Sphaerisporangium krabiense TaxID=763782 RepID=A0A7W8Z7U2_9ACTN|nr:hypothetical protein [Sphaerisporangium krabiense]
MSRSLPEGSEPLRGRGLLRVPGLPQGAGLLRSPGALGSRAPGSPGALWSRGLLSTPQSRGLLRSPQSPGMPRTLRAPASPTVPSAPVAATSTGLIHMVMISPGADVLPARTSLVSPPGTTPQSGPGILTDPPRQAASRARDALVPSSGSRGPAGPLIRRSKTDSGSLGGLRGMDGRGRNLLGQARGLPRVRGLVGGGPSPGTSRPGNHKSLVAHTSSSAGTRKPPHGDPPLTAPPPQKHHSPPKARHHSPQTHP